MACQSPSNSAAEGYRQASLKEQKLDGVSFIEADICPQAGDIILDLGCGTGELSAYLAELVGSEGNVIGVDPDKERIQLARQSHGQVKNLSFVEGNASNFPDVASMRYDIIFSNYALHWIPNKKDVFKNMFACLNVGGKVAVQYIERLPPFEFNGYMILNPENGERICQKMYQCEPRAKFEHYCSTAGFQIVKSYTSRAQFAFESINSLLKWHWSTTHGVFDLSLVTEERLQRYLAPYTDEDGTPCLDFRGIEKESTVCRLVAIKEGERFPNGH